MGGRKRLPIKRAGAALRPFLFLKAIKACEMVGDNAVVSYARACGIA
jgi:hypothetical protein